MNDFAIRGSGLQQVLKEPSLLHIARWQIALPRNAASIQYVMYDGVRVDSAFKRHTFPSSLEGLLCFCARSSRGLSSRHTLLPEGL